MRLDQEAPEAHGTRLVPWQRPLSSYDLQSREADDGPWFKATEHIRAK